MGTRRTDELATLRHDLRQLVAAGEVLARMPGDERLDGDVRGRFDRIKRILTDMEALVEAPSEDGSRVWTVDLTEMVNDCIAVVEPTRPARFQRPGRQVCAAVPDPVLLRRALVNLLDNAARAAGEGGRVSVAVTKRGADALIEVSDDGAGFGGIPGVTGHGLATVNRALRACHGSLQIDSEPGHGTTVRIRLPRRSCGEAVTS